MAEGPGSGSRSLLALKGLQGCLWGTRPAKALPPSLGALLNAWAAGRAEGTARGSFPSLGMELAEFSGESPIAGQGAKGPQGFWLLLCVVLARGWCCSSAGGATGTRCGAV